MTPRGTAKSKFDTATWLAKRFVTPGPAPSDEKAATEKKSTKAEEDTNDEDEDEETAEAAVKFRQRVTRHRPFFDLEAMKACAQNRRGACAKSWPVHLDVFDFELNAAEMRALTAFTRPRLAGCHRGSCDCDVP